MQLRNSPFYKYIAAPHNSDFLRRREFDPVRIRIDPDANTGDDCPVSNDLPCIHGCVVHPIGRISVSGKHTLSGRRYYVAHDLFPAEPLRLAVDCPYDPTADHNCAACGNTMQFSPVVFACEDTVVDCYVYHPTCARFCVCCMRVVSPEECYDWVVDESLDQLPEPTDLHELMAHATSRSTPDLVGRMDLCNRCHEKAAECLTCSRTWVGAENKRVLDTAGQCPACITREQRREQRRRDRTTVSAAIDRMAQLGASAGDSARVPKRPWQEWLGPEIARRVAPGARELYPDSDSDSDYDEYTHQAIV